MAELRFKRKKNVKYRGSKTHGGGSMKKRRGAGHRGGRGNAGSGKRGDSKKPTHINAGRVFGRNGFVNPTTRGLSVMNVSDVQRYIDNGVAKKTLKEQAQYELDLGGMRVDKLLGKGELSHKVAITVEFASASAVEKVQQAGGSVTVTSASEQASSDDSSDE